MRLGLRGCAIAAVLVCSDRVGAIVPRIARPLVAPVAATNDLPPRLQWNTNFGYCGEVAFITAGLYYGQYLSQYDARALASNGAAQNLASSQLLIGVNDTAAAAAMHLNVLEWNTAAETSTEAFLGWVRANVLEKHPVAMGVYTNEYLFYGKTNPTAGDPDYDHIVPVLGVASTHPLAAPTAYFPDDVLTFSDNGLWTGTTGSPTYIFSSAFGALQATRAQANAKMGAIYSLTNDASNYGVAVTGVIDQDNETVPVRVSTDKNSEVPAIGAGSNTRPAPEPLVLTVTVSGLTPGVSYNLYRYDAMTAVPNAAFNANAAAASEHWSFQIQSGSTHVQTENIMSDEVAAYRAVPASAP